MEPIARPKLIRFGLFEIDLHSRELFKSGHHIKIQDQPFRVLVMLLEKPGELVTRQELQQRLWPKDTFVAFDHSLNADIQRLRQALGDSAQNPKFIETLPRKGYRFICPVEVSTPDVAKSGPSWPRGWRVLKGKSQPAPLPDDEPESDNALSGEEPTLKPQGPLNDPGKDVVHREAARGRESSNPRSWGLWKSAAVGAILIAIGVAYWRARTGSVEPEPALVPVPFTTDPGRESFPSFSPDGNQVAFSWNGEKQDNWDIYLKQIGSESLRRLTTHPETDICPVFSPDGRYIAFLRVKKDQKATLLRIPVIGRPEQPLAEVTLPEGDFYIRPGPYLAWFPDSKQMVIVNKTLAAEPSCLYLFSVDTRQIVRLTRPSAGSGDDDAPAISPDGRWLAFSRGAEVCHLYLLELSDDHRPKGEPHQITFENQHANSPVWAAGGREIIFSMGLYQEHTLWRMGVSKGIANKPVRLAFAGEGAWYPAISHLGHRLAFMRWVGGGSEIWRVDVPTRNGKAIQPIRLISSTRDDEEPEYSPDGKQIVFKSNRSGRLEIWVSSSDGSNPFQLTFGVGENTFLPRWSPDGRHILFTSNPDGQNDLFLIDARGGNPQRLTAESSNEVAAVFSRDGRWIYFHSDRTGKKQIWKMPAHLSGDDRKAVQVTHNGGISPEESPDGRFLYYLKEGNPKSLWKLPLEGGEEVQLLPSVLYDNFTVIEDGIVFIDNPSQNRYSLEFLDIASGKTTVLCEPSDPGWGLTVSPVLKGIPRSILYVNCRVNDSDLMLVENFR